MSNSFQEYERKSWHDDEEMEDVIADELLDLDAKSLFIGYLLGIVTAGGYLFWYLSKTSPTPRNT